MKDLSKRTVTATVFAIILLFLVWYSFYTFMLLLLIITFGGLWELQNLFIKARFLVNKNYLWIKILLSVLFLLYPCFDDNVSFSKIQYFVFTTLSIILFTEFLFRNDFFKGIAEFFIALYLLLFLNATLSIFYFHQNRQYSYEYPLAIILIIWANDTFAYFIGSLTGKHKLMPEISPKKSIEGFFGGFLFAIITAFIVHQYLLPNISNSWKLSDMITIAFLISSVGTVADLIESKLKRLADVKDSGNTLPGHGGILDRFDSWYLSIPAIQIYFQLKEFITI